MANNLRTRMHEIGDTNRELAAVFEDPDRLPAVIRTVERIHEFLNDGTTQDGVGLRNWLRREGYESRTGQGGGGRETTARFGAMSMRARGGIAPERWITKARLASCWDDC